MKKLLSLLLLIGVLQGENKTPEQEYNDFLRENNFEKCKANITPQDIDDLFNYVSPASKEAQLLNFYLINREQRVHLLAIEIAECQQRPLHKEGYTCAGTMLKLKMLSRLYWLWPTEAQRKASQVVAEYKKNMIDIAEKTVDFDTKTTIFKVAHDIRMNDNKDLPPYKPRLIHMNNNTSFLLDEEILYNQLIACTDASKRKEDCIAGLKDHEKFRRSLGTKRNFVSGGGMLMAAFDTLGADYLHNNVHGITSEDITE